MGLCISLKTSDQLSESNYRVKGKLRKREAAEALAAAIKNDELIALAAGRTCSNGSSRIASLFTQQGRKGINQDAMLLWEGFGDRKDSIMCGVFDGHGPYGHLVARRVRDSLPFKLLSEWQELSMRRSEASIGTENVAGADMCLEEPETGSLLEPEVFDLWRDSHLIAYKIMDKELRAHPSLDCFCSGTTAVTVLKQGKDLVVANVGDSRAVLGTRSDSGALVAVQLTVDLKPNLPEEAERITRCKGRVFALHDEPEVQRVWLPHDNSPGLAMARAFGDFCLKEFGVIAVPEISHRKLTDQDQFVVLATDGIWDVLSNDEVVDIIATAPTRRTAARSLVECAVRAWRLKYPTSKVDDCAVVCLYLNENTVRPEHLVKKDKSLSRTTQDQEDSHSSNATNNSADGDNEHVTLTASEVESKGAMEQAMLPSKPTIEHSSSLTAAEGMADQQNKRVLLAQRSLKECLGANDDEWSALEGITRVNSLLNLPRFPGHDQEGARVDE